jgi:predicted ATPase/DNA-binding SARP family transcriptional activator
MARLRLEYFGAFTAQLDGAPLRFAYAKQAALLAYLGLAGGQPVPRPRLGLLLWPDKPPQAVQTNLRKVISSLRGVLQPAGSTSSLLAAEGDTVRIRPEADLWVDVLAFQALLADCVAHPHRHAANCAACASARQAACDMYAGDFLADLRLDDSDEFEAWATTHREALRLQALAACQALAEYNLLRGRTPEAQRAVQRLLAIDPLHEEGNRLALAALAAAGQAGAAISHYEQFRRLLARELDAPPDEATQRLAEAIRAGNWEVYMPAPVPDTGGVLLPSIEPLVGRTVEVNELNAWLGDPNRRLINIVGLGGTGKTHLAAAVAHGQRRVFRNGVVFVSLEHIQTPEQFEAALLQVCDVPSRGEGALLPVLARHIGGKDILLVLDHFEQLLAAGTVLVQLLQACPNLVILVTSRRRLGLGGEWVFPLEGLEIPPTGIDISLESYSAANLFLRAARQVRHGLLLDAAARRAVADICRLVEGLPLALVLLAAWVRVLPPAELALELRRSIDVVRAARPSAAGEQLSLRSVLQQSWQSLGDKERAALAGLAVFQGGFDRHAAAAVAAADLDTLSSLADHSLLQVTAEGRYSWHELVRQFAAEQLLAESQADATAARHFAYYLAEAERNAAGLATFSDLAAFLWFGRESANLDAALAWAQNPRSGVPAAVLQRFTAAVQSAGHREGVHLTALRRQ